MLYSGNYLMFIRSEAQLEKLMKRVESQVQLYLADYGKNWGFWIGNWIKKFHNFLINTFLYRIRLCLSGRLPGGHLLQSRSAAIDEEVRRGTGVSWDHLQRVSETFLLNIFDTKNFAKWVGFEIVALHYHID